MKKIPKPEPERLDLFKIQMRRLGLLVISEAALLIGITNSKLKYAATLSQIKLTRKTLNGKTRFMVDARDLKEYAQKNRIKVTAELDELASEAKIQQGGMFPWPETFKEYSATTPPRKPTSTLTNPTPKDEYDFL